MTKPLVIIPTLNEADNIAILIRRLLKSYDHIDILIVDGNSSDGTQNIVRELEKEIGHLKLIVQQQKSSYGEAIQIGFKYALDNAYDPVITMDGDLSHSTDKLADFLDLSSDYDLVIGSRYIDGVRVEGWQFRKLLFSKLANMYISYMLVRPIWDFTSGYRLYRRRFLERINISHLEKFAYLFQIQTVYLAYKYHCRVKEIPIVFHDHYPGRSKVLQQSFFVTIAKVLKYRAPVKEIFRHVSHINRDYHNFVKEYEELVNPPNLKKDVRIGARENSEISLGVMAYNEEQIIGKCLEALQNQKLSKQKIKEIIVISSGSTDRTDEIVTGFAERDFRIKLVCQSRRLGKASAINEYLSRASGDILIIESADTITREDTIEQLVAPFSDPQIGMTGAHPIPVNKKDTLAGFFTHKLWTMHDLVAREHPKCGEMIAFRNVINSIPNYVAVDEAVIEAIIRRAGLNIAYVPEAIVYNKGSETIKDFMLQRKRIAAGHLHVSNTMGYHVATMNSFRIFKYIMRSQKWNPLDMFKMVLLIGFEAYARILGKFDYYFRNKNPFIWDISKSTKEI